MFAAFTDTQSHSFRFGPQANQPLNFVLPLAILRPLNAQIDETVFLKLASGIEVSNQKSCFLILFSNLSHQFDVHLFGKVLNKFFEVCNWGINVHLVLPFVFSPLEFEFQLGTVSWHESVNEVDLDLVDVDHVRLIATSAVKSQIPVNCAVVCRRNF